MLTRLSVRQIVLIEKLDLDFNSGLTVFTGETGAGKSILLDSLSLALGARADVGLIRHGEKEASVTACFSLNMVDSVGILLAEHGISFDGDLILRRTLSADGRSHAFVNDEPVSIGFLRKLGDFLVEIHGQFASHRLLNPATHLDTLDMYGSLTDSHTNCRHAYQIWQYKKEERNTAEQALMQAQKEEEYLRHAVVDLEKLNPLPDEEEQLIQKRTALMNSEKIVTALNTAYAVLSDEDMGCIKRLGEVLKQLEHANAWADNSLSDISEQTSHALALIEDTAGTLEKNMEKWGNISELPEIDDRLFSLRDMARKHQVPISELPDLLVKLKEQLVCLEIGEAGLMTLRQEEEKSRLEYLACAEKLSKERLETAIRLDRAVSCELPSLKLSKAQFKTQIDRLPEELWNESGFDKVSFLVSTNKGTPLAPIHKIASGGELSRFMLALKVNLAMADDVGTLIFDEVDSGVGGATADSVGARLQQLAETHQVLVVTHSPQVAAYGQSHLTVRKEEKDSVVLTQVMHLTGQERTDEIARMLSGAEITQTACSMAQELLSTCSKK